MKIANYYLEEFIELYDKMFDEQHTYNDTVGTYYFPKIGLQVRKWNNKVEYFEQNNMDETITNLLMFMKETCRYWFEEVKNDTTNM